MNFSSGKAVEIQLLNINPCTKVAKYVFNLNKNTATFYILGKKKIYKNEHTYSKSFHYVLSTSGIPKEVRVR